MPAPVLPSTATSHMSAGAYMRLRDSEHSPIEKFTILYYGEIDGDEIVALLGEVDRDTWVEDVANSDDRFTF